LAINDPRTEMGMTSIDMVNNLMLTVEDEFDIVNPTSEIIPRKFSQHLMIEALVAKLTPWIAGREF
jgi:hypothetical protein